MQDPNVQLIRAVCDGRVEKVRSLLKDDSIDVDWRDKEGRTALHDACWWGRPGIAELLLDHGADVEIPSSSPDTSTSLQIACYRGNSSTVKLLLARGANVHTLNNYGDTALHVCSFDTETNKHHYIVETNKHHYIVEELLAHGADPTVTNVHSRTPLDTARDNGRYDIVDILTRHRNEEGEEKSRMHIPSSLKAQDVTTACANDQNKPVAPLKNLQLDESITKHVDDQMNTKISSMEYSISNLDMKLQTLIDDSTAMKDSLRNKKQIDSTVSLEAVSLKNQALHLKMAALEESLDKRIEAIVDKKLEHLVHDRMLGAVVGELKESLSQSVGSEIKETLKDYFSDE